MEFLTSYIWYTTMILVFFFSFLHHFGHHTRGTYSYKISIFGRVLVGIILSIAVSLIIIGEIGGIVILAIYFIILNPLAHRVSFWVFKKLHPDAHYLTYGFFKLRGKEIAKNRHRTVEDLKKEYMEALLSGKEREIQRFVKLIKEDPRTRQILIQLNINESIIDEMYELLSNYGVSDFIIKCSLVSPAMINDFVAMKKKGYKDEDIVFYCIESLGGVI